MNNDVFSLGRFKNYLRKLLIENKRFLVISSIILCSLFFIVELWASFSFYDSSKIYHDMAAGVISSVAIVIFFIGGCVMASRLFSDGQQKASRIHVLNTPVSTFESWLSRVMIYIVGYVVVFVVGFYLIDTLRVAFFSATMPKIVVVFCVPSNEFFTYVLPIYSYFISCYLLGAFFVPRHPLLVTTLFLIIATFLFFITRFFSMSGINYDTFTNLMMAWIYLLIIVNTVLSYMRYKELEVIDHQ